MQERAVVDRRDALRAAAGAPLDEELVTIVVPARNEAAFLAPCLDSLLAQTKTRLEVLVVDGRSEDGTAALVRAYAARDARVRLVDNPERIVPTGLNRALLEANGAWLVRVDAHATVPPEYVAVALEHLRSGRWGGVGGRKDGVGVTPSGVAVAAAMASRFGVGPGSTYHHGTTAQTVDHIPFGAYPTALARSLGGWDEDLVTNQDYEFDHRVRESGHELLFDPRLRIAWHSRQSVPALYRQYRRYGEGKIQVLARHPGSVRPRQVLPALLVAGMAVGFALLGARRTRALGVAALAPYPLAVAAASAVTAAQVRGWPARARLPGAFMAMHLGWGVGLWRGAARRVGSNLLTGPSSS